MTWCSSAAHARRADLRPPQRRERRRAHLSQTRAAGLLRRGDRPPVGAGRRAASAPHREPARGRASHFLGGIVTVVADAQVVGPGDGALYRAEPYPAESAQVVAIPYYLWNNRGPNRMLVWLPEV